MYDKNNPSLGPTLDTIFANSKVLYFECESTADLTGKTFEFKKNNVWQEDLGILDYFTPWLSQITAEYTFLS